MDTLELQIPDTAPPPQRRGFGAFVAGVLLAGVVAAAAWFALDLGRDDAPALPSLSWAASTIEVSEGATPTEITVVLGTPREDATVVEIVLSGDRAGDVTLEPSTLVFAPGELEGTVAISVANDADMQGASAVTAELQPVDGVDLSQPTLAMIVLDDEDVSARPPSATTTTVSPETPPGSQPPVTVAPGQALSPVVPTLLGADSATQVQSVSTPSVELGADRLVLLSLVTFTSNRRTEVPAVTGGGLQWELVATQTRNEGPRRLSVFRAMPTETTTASITLEFGAVEGLVHWAVVEYDNVLTGANGANAVVQAAGSAAVGFEFFGQVELEPFAHADNATVGVFFAGVSGIEPEPGYVELAELRLPKRTMAAMFRPEADPTVATAEWGSGAHWLGIALEIQAAPE